MDVSLLIRQRLSELGLEQKDLASAAQVTESYISQLLARKKAPPAPGRTDIYEKIGEYLRLPSGELSRLADLQRQEELKKRVVESPPALLQATRELILRKCDPRTQLEIRRIFEKEAFGELERLITQTVLNVTQAAVRNELENQEWQRRMAQATQHSYEQLRVMMLDFLATEVFDISVDHCVSFLNSMIGSWDIDLKTFAMEILLNPEMSPGGLKRFEFIEREITSTALEPAFELFLKDASLSVDITEEEIEFLKELKFRGRRPSPIYYYRALQDLRDPLHFN